MTNKDKTAFAEIMMACGENYGVTLTPAGIAMRFEALREYDISDLRRAAMSLLRSRKYTSMPTIADFLEHMGGSAEDRSEIAAGKALRAVAEVGSYASVTFDDPVLMAVIENGWGSWPEFCAACSGTEVKFMRRELAKTYAAYARQGIRRYGHLSGITENNNGRAGYFEHIPAPRLVGSREEAARVLAAGVDQAALTGAGTAALQDAIRRELPCENGIVQ